MTLNRVAIPSPSYSNRGSAPVRLLVIHTAEGSRTIESLGGWFANPSNKVSSHAGADDKPNTVGIYVQRAYSAWTAASANPVSCQIELCGFASWDAAEWSRHPNMLQNTASWLAEEAAAFGVPLTRLNPSQAQGSGRGVCAHADLGSWGGNHWDPGPNFPMDQVIAMAKGQPAPGPTPTKRKGNMIASTGGQGYWTVTSDGAVYAFGNAQYVGGPNRDKVLQPGVTAIGIAGHGNDGYWIEGSDGSIFAYGSAQFAGRPDRA